MSLADMQHLTPREREALRLRYPINRPKRLIKEVSSLMGIVSAAVRLQEAEFALTWLRWWESRIRAGEPLRLTIQDWADLEEFDYIQPSKAMLEWMRYFRRTQIR